MLLILGHFVLVGFTSGPSYVSSVSSFNLLSCMQHLSAPMSGSTPLWFGLLAHLGPTALFSFLIGYFGTTTVWAALTAFSLSAAPGVAVVLCAKRARPSVPTLSWTWLDFVHGMTKQVIVDFGGSVLVTACLFYLFWALAAHPPPTPLAHVPWLRICVVFLLTDLYYYVYHRWANHEIVSFNRYLRQLHKIHHSVPFLDLLRGGEGHFLDLGILSFALPSGVFGFFTQLDFGSIIISYMACMLLQVTSHSNHHFELCVVRYVIMDGHAHKWHHVARYSRCNYGATYRFGIAFAALTTRIDRVLLASW